MKALSYKKAALARRLTGSATIALSIGLLSLSAPALAQEAEEAPKDKDIVVTGTLIRGSAPVGSNEITLDASKFDETGASSANELLASVPQVTNYFNRVPATDLSVAVNQIQISRPNIRNMFPVSTNGTDLRL